MVQLITVSNSGNVNTATDSVITNFGGIDINKSIINTGFSDPFLMDSNGIYFFSGSYTEKFLNFLILITIWVVYLLKWRIKHLWDGKFNQAYYKWY